jgi:apolipoprotein N-acyltransferase
VACFVLGGITGFSFPPLNLFFLMAFGFSGFVLLLNREQKSSVAFLKGFLFGFGYFLASTYWVALSFRCVGLHYWVPFVAIAFAIMLAFFPALASWLTVCFFSRAKQNRVIFALLFTFFWSICEWMRGHVLTGFPWNLTGYVWGLPILQTTAWIGIYGLSLFTTWFACVWGCGNRKLIIFTCGLFLVFWGAGTWRLTGPIEETTLSIRLVQPSIEQKLKWNREHLDENMMKHMALSKKPSLTPLHIVVWPEAAVSYDLENPSVRDVLFTSIPKGAFLILGGIRRQKITENQLRIFNSLFVLSPWKNQIQASYDKAHLVPFGEYVPFKRFLSLQKLTDGITDYTEGEGIRTLDVQGIPPFSPLICYEVVFPGRVVDRSKRPEWLLNLTNDAWYGVSAGPYQHLAIARVRAIEEGLPLVRAANNGISAIISPYGHILKQLSSYEVGFLDFYLPKFLKRTVYGRYYDSIFYCFMLIWAFTLVVIGRKNDQEKKIKSD